MGFNSFISKLFGNKAGRDMKALRPVVDKVNAVYPEIQKLSNDELRARTDQIKAQLQEMVQPKRDEIAKLNLMRLTSWKKKFSTSLSRDLMKTCRWSLPS